MPSRNVIRIDVENAFYHVYARGASKQPIFLERADYIYFLSLFERYLSPLPTVSKTGMPYPHCHDQVRLLTYCLMPNHFHLLLYQIKPGGITMFMRGLMTSYSRYFNLKYGRSGSLFESRYKAVLVNKPEYLEHISRYIHLNPRYWRQYPYSSLKYYKKSPPEWLHPEQVLAMFSSPDAYFIFLNDYVSRKALLDAIKHDLADT